MEQKMLNINDLYVSDEPVTYVCYGLGSCIGLFVQDKQRQLSGGVHIAAASRSTHGKLKDAASLFEELLEGLVAKGSDLSNLTAKYTGGSYIFDILQSAGSENTREVKSLLIQNKIYVAASDTGGNKSRTARFNSQTGQLCISTSEKRKYCI